MVRKNSFLRYGLGILLGSVILIYTLFNSLTFLKGPELIITRPTNGETFDEELLTIEGEVRNAAFITLNDRQIYVDDTGKLFDQLLLYPGYNILTMKARDKFDREVVIIREITYAPKMEEARIDIPSAAELQSTSTATSTVQ